MSTSTAASISVSAASAFTHPCSLCKSHEATVRCETCDMNLCTVGHCDDEMHSATALKSHTRTTFPIPSSTPNSTPAASHVTPSASVTTCELCESYPAEVRCDECKMDLCIKGACDSELHTGARTAGHIRKPLTSTATPSTTTASSHSAPSPSATAANPIPTATVTTPAPSNKPAPSPALNAPPSSSLSAALSEHASSSSTSNLCEICHQFEAVARCDTCQMNLCTDGRCDAEIHAASKLKSHSRTALPGKTYVAPAVVTATAVLAPSSEPAKAAAIPAATPSVEKPLAAAPALATSTSATASSTSIPLPLTVPAIPSNPCGLCHQYEAVAKCDTCQLNLCTDGHCDTEIHSAAALKSHVRTALPNKVYKTPAATISTTAPAPVTPAAPKEVVSSTSASVPPTSETAASASAEVAPVAAPKPSAPDAAASTDISDPAADAAATKIQSAFRGTQARKEVAQLKDQKKSATDEKITTPAPSAVIPTPTPAAAVSVVATSATSAGTSALPATTTPAAAPAAASMSTVSATPSTPTTAATSTSLPSVAPVTPSAPAVAASPAADESAAATKIQAAYRGAQTRKEVATMKTQSKPAASTQETKPSDKAPASTSTPAAATTTSVAPAGASTSATVPAATPAPVSAADAQTKKDEAKRRAAEAVAAKRKQRAEEEAAAAASKDVKPAATSDALPLAASPPVATPPAVPASIAEAFISGPDADAAATKIQSAFRGTQARKSFAQLKEQQTPAEAKTKVPVAGTPPVGTATTPAPAETPGTGTVTAASSAAAPTAASAATTASVGPIPGPAISSSATLAPPFPNGDESVAATKIQAAYRGSMTRKEVATMKAALNSGSTPLDAQAKKDEAKRRAAEAVAAKRKQRAEEEAATAASGSAKSDTTTNQAATTTASTPTNPAPVPAVTAAIAPAPAIVEAEIAGPEADAAATKIQSAFRGTQARKEVAQLKEQKKTVPEVKSAIVAEPAAAAAATPLIPTATPVQVAVAAPAAAASSNTADETLAATKIQAVYRGSQSRKEVATLKSQAKPAQAAQEVKPIELAQTSSDKPVPVAVEPAAAPIAAPAPTPAPAVAAIPYELFLNTAPPGSDSPKKSELAPPVAAAEPSVQCDMCDDEVAVVRCEDCKMNLCTKAGCDKDLHTPARTAYHVRKPLRPKAAETVPTATAAAPAPAVPANATEVTEAPAAAPIAEAPAAAASTINVSSPEQNAAAVAIQSNFRGHKIRKEVEEIRRSIDRIPSIVITPPFHTRSTSLSAIPSSAEKPTEKSSELKIASTGSTPAKPVADAVLSASKTEEEAASIKIQAAFRGSQTRKEVSKLKEEKKKTDTQPTTEVLATPVKATISPDSHMATPAATMVTPIKSEATSPKMVKAPLCEICEEFDSVVFCAQCSMHLCTQGKCDQNIHASANKATHVRVPVETQAMQTSSLPPPTSNDGMLSDFSSLNISPLISLPVSPPNEGMTPSAAVMCEVCDLFPSVVYCPQCSLRLCSQGLCDRNMHSSALTANHVRQAMIGSLDLRGAQVDAAIRIQASYRGHVARKNVEGLRKAKAVQEQQRTPIVKAEDAKSHTIDPSDASVSFEIAGAVDCDLCFARQATLRCDECEMHLCEENNCDRDLHSKPATKSHIRKRLKIVANPSAKSTSTAPTAVSDQGSKPAEGMAISIQPPPSDKVRLCDICEDKPAEVRCSECSMDLCIVGGCDRSLHAIAANMHHNRYPLTPSTKLQPAPTAATKKEDDEKKEIPAAVSPTHTKRRSSATFTFDVAEPEASSGLPPLSPKVKKVPKCDLCEEFPSKFYCRECKLYLCEGSLEESNQCDRNIHKQARLAGHIRIEAADAVAQQKAANAAKPIAGNEHVTLSEYSMSLGLDDEKRDTEPSAVSASASLPRMQIFLSEDMHVKPGEPHLSPANNTLLSPSQQIVLQRRFSKRANSISRIQSEVVTEEDSDEESPDTIKLSAPPHVASSNTVPFVPTIPSSPPADILYCEMCGSEEASIFCAECGMNLCYILQYDRDGLKREGGCSVFRHSQPKKAGHKLKELRSLIPPSLSPSELQHVRSASPDVIESLSEHQHSTMVLVPIPLCDLCGEYPVTYHCLDCDLKLCDVFGGNGCERGVHRKPGNANHHRVRLNKSANSSQTATPKRRPSDAGLTDTAHLSSRAQPVKQPLTEDAAASRIQHTFRRHSARKSDSKRKEAEEAERKALEEREAEAEAKKQQVEEMYKGLQSQQEEHELPPMLPRASSRMKRRTDSSAAAAAADMVTKMRAAAEAREKDEKSPSAASLDSISEDQPQTASVGPVVVVPTTPQTPGTQSRPMTPVRSPPAAPMSSPARRFAEEQAHKAEIEHRKEALERLAAVQQISIKEELATNPEIDQSHHEFQLSLASLGLGATPPTNSNPNTHRSPPLPMASPQMPAGRYNLSQAVFIQSPASSRRSRHEEMHGKLSINSSASSVRTQSHSRSPSRHAISSLQSPTNAQHIDDSMRLLDSPIAQATPSPGMSPLELHPASPAHEQHSYLQAELLRVTNEARALGMAQQAERERALKLEAEVAALKAQRQMEEYAKVAAEEAERAAKEKAHTAKLELELTDMRSAMHTLEHVLESQGNLHTNYLSELDNQMKMLAITRNMVTYHSIELAKKQSASKRAARDAKRGRAGRVQDRSHNNSGEYPQLSPGTNYMPGGSPYAAPGPKPTHSPGGVPLSVRNDQAWATEEASQGPFVQADEVEADEFDYFPLTSNPDATGAAIFRPTVPRPPSATARPSSARPRGPTSAAAAGFTAYAGSASTARLPCRPTSARPASQASGRSRSRDNRPAFDVRSANVDHVDRLAADRQSRLDYSESLAKKRASSKQSLVWHEPNYDSLPPRPQETIPDPLRSGLFVKSQPANILNKIFSESASAASLPHGTSSMSATSVGMVERMKQYGVFPSANNVPLKAFVELDEKARTFNRGDRASPPRTKSPQRFPTSSPPPKEWGADSAVISEHLYSPAPLSPYRIAKQQAWAKAQLKIGRVPDLSDYAHIFEGNVAFDPAFIRNEDDDDGEDGEGVESGEEEEQGEEVGEEEEKHPAGSASAPAPGHRGGRKGKRVVFRSKQTMARFDPIARLSAGFSSVPFQMAYTPYLRHLAFDIASRKLSAPGNPVVPRREHSALLKKLANPDNLPGGPERRERIDPQGPYTFEATHPPFLSTVDSTTNNAANGRTGRRPAVRQVKSRPASAAPRSQHHQPRPPSVDASTSTYDQPRSHNSTGASASSNQAQVELRPTPPPVQSLRTAMAVQNNNEPVDPEEATAAAAAERARKEQAALEAKEAKKQAEREAKELKAQQAKEAKEKKEREAREAKEKKEREAKEAKERKEREAREAKEKKEAAERAAKEEAEQLAAEAKAQKEQEEAEARERAEREAAEAAAKAEADALAAKEKAEREAKEAQELKERQEKEEAERREREEREAREKKEAEEKAAAEKAAKEAAEAKAKAEKEAKEAADRAALQAEKEKIRREAEERARKQAEEDAKPKHPFPVPKVCALCEDLPPEVYCPECKMFMCVDDGSGCAPDMHKLMGKRHHQTFPVGGTGAASAAAATAAPPTTAAAATPTPAPAAAAAATPVAAPAPTKPAVKKTVLCDMCEDEDASVHCNDCDMDLCTEGCDQDLHKPMNKKNHVRVPLNGSAPAAAAAAAPAPAKSASPAEVVDCSLCDDADAVVWCAECQMNLCKENGCDAELHTGKKAAHVRKPL